MTVTLYTYFSGIALDEAELAEFETGLEQIWLKHSAVSDPEMAKIVEKHRLPLHQQAHMRELLFKNREGELTETEETELDFYMAKMDQALEATANELLKLKGAQHFRQALIAVGQHPTV